MDIYLQLRVGLNFCELLAAATGFIFWKSNSNTYWKWFPIYLAVVFITEVTGEMAGYYIGSAAFNYNLYTFFCIPMQFLFFLWLFWQYFKTYSYRIWLSIGMVLYISAFLIDTFFLAGHKFNFFSFSYMAGNVVLVASTILFFFVFVRTDEILKYKSSKMFWVSLGLLIFYLLSLPLYGLWNTLAVNYPFLFNKYWIVTTFLNYLMYLLFTLSIIWTKVK